MRRRAYVAELQRDFRISGPFLLGLGGLAASSGFGLGAGMVAGGVAVLLATPLRSLNAGLDKKVELVKEAVQDRKNLALFHLLFQLYSSVSDTTKLLNKANRAFEGGNHSALDALTEKLRIHAGAEYPRCLAGLLYEIIGFKQERYLLRFLRYDPRQVRTLSRQYVDDIKKVLVLTQKDAEYWDALADADRTWARLREKLRDFQLVQCGTVVLHALDVALQPGTSHAAQGLVDTSYRLHTEGAGLKKIKMLHTLADRGRGFRLSSLADVPPEDAGDVDRIRALLELRTESASNLAARAAQELRKDFQDATVLTADYSSSVIEIIDSCRDFLRDVAVVQTDSVRTDDHDRMVEALRARGHKVYTVRPDACQCSGAGKLLALFGFEACSLTGEIVHPHGPNDVLHKLRMLEKEAGVQVTTVAAGPSWKFRSFEPAGCDADLVVQRRDGFDFVLWEGGLIRRTGSERREYVAAARTWAERRAAALEAAAASSRTR